MTVAVVTTAYGAAALAALAEVVAAIRGGEGVDAGDAMSMVTIIAPNNIAGLVARRHLAAGTAERPGVAAIDVTTLARLSERVAMAALAGRRPATRQVLAACLRQALADAPGAFNAIAGHPSTVRALAEAYPQLRDLSPGALDAVGNASSLTRDLVRLFRAVRAALADDWYDTTDVLNIATGLLSRQGRSALGACVLYLPQALNQAEARFARALSEAGELSVIAGMTRARRADEAVERTLALLGTRAGPLPAIATATEVANASDSDDEVRMVVREVVQALKRTPAKRIGVLYAATLPYARLLHEHLAASGITVNGPGIRPTDERAVARSLLELLELGDADVPRAEMFRALANAPVRDFTGKRIPLSRWERISRSAGVVSGDDWQVRIGAFIADRHALATSEQHDLDPHPARIERYQADIEASVQLRDFACRLRAELRQANALTSWAELASWCQRIFQSLIGDAEELGRMPEEEQYAAASIVSLLSGLAGLDAIDGSASLAGLRDVLRVELASSSARVGHFGEGVLVAPLSAAVGLDLDVAFVVGVSEDVYPGRLLPDALLPERVRRLSGGELLSERERLHAKYRHLLAAFAVASERVVVSFPRGDLRRSSRRLPSRWLLPSLRALSGDFGLTATDWQEPETYAGRLATSGSYAGELLRTDRLASEQEWRVRQASATGQLDDSIVRAAREMISGRASSDFTRFDGNLAGVDGLPDYAHEKLTVSPTALESYADCPHSFYVQRLLRVQPLDQPENVVVISPMQIGNLVHESVDALVREYVEALPGFGEPWNAEQRARLLEIVQAKADEFERRGLTGHPRLWQRERMRVMSDADWLLEDDNAWRAKVGARVLASEMPFGLHGQPPVEVPIPGGRVVMTGSADKVDLGADGTLYVTDIKTGSARTFTDIAQDNPVVGGRKLQLPVYAYAARQRYGEQSSTLRALYWFVRRDRGRIGIDLTAELERTYATTLAVLVRSIAQGYFPQRAPEIPDFAWVQCDYCNPDGIGHAENRERWERKRHDPRLLELVGLIEPDALAERD